MKLNRNDLKMLRAALASNGGGVSDQLYPDAVRIRLLKAGLIQWKPNQHRGQHDNYRGSMMTITALGKSELLSAETEEKKE